MSWRDTDSAKTLDLIFQRRTSSMKGMNMKLYALEIRKSELDLIALFNDGGVIPKVTKPYKYFVFNAENDSTFVPKIMTKREFLQSYDIKGTSPLVLSVKPA